MFLTLHSKKSNAVAVFCAFIKKLNIPVTRFTIQHELEEHPDYPSMLSFSDCLNRWKIPHEAFQINKANYKPERLSYPFIAHLNEDGGRFILVQENIGGRVKFSDDLGENRSFSEEEYLKKWDGVLLFAKKGKESGEDQYWSSAIKGYIDTLRLPFLVLVLLLAIYVALDTSKSNGIYLSQLGVKLAGITISVLLILQSINTHNPFIQNLCNLGKKNDCNAILKSRAAQVTSWLTWSEVGLFYFFGSFICLLVKPDAIAFLAILNLLCLPYTFYSVGYQIKMKNWCLLCCSIQVLLWAEAFLFIFGSKFSFTDFHIPQLFPIILCFFVPMALWLFLKPLLLRSEQIKPLKQQLKKFKYNSDLFNQLLTNQQKYIIPDDLMPVVLGNPNADTVITVVSNPYCEPCGVAHRILEGWLEDRDDLQVKIVFTTNNQETDLRTQVARHVTELALLGDKEVVRHALNDWYGKRVKKYEVWAEQYPVTFNGEAIGILEKHKNWSKIAEIRFTPTILINGYKLVEPYRLEDIQYLLV